jgi:hypothetical protein
MIASEGMEVQSRYKIYFCMRISVLQKYEKFHS